MTVPVKTPQMKLVGRIEALRVTDDQTIRRARHAAETWSDGYNTALDDVGA